MAHILIVQSRFYPELADHLGNGAVEVIDDYGHTREFLSVPGALEIPGAIKLAAQSGKYDAYVALGTVIRGETYHFEIVANESARALMDLSIHDGLAVGNGILTCETMVQAMERADPAQKNKGGEAALAAIGLLQIKQKLSNGS